MMNTAISNGPSADRPGTPGAPSRVSAGAPGAPLKSVRKPPAADAADTSTLDMLGSNPLNGNLGDSATGSAGMAMGGLAAIAKGVQVLSQVVPGFVPPPMLQWLDQAMQQLPQLLQQQSSTSSLPPQMGQSGPADAPPPTAALPPPGPPRAPMGALTGGMSSMGGMG